MQHFLSLAEPVPGMIPVMINAKSSPDVDKP